MLDGGSSLGRRKPVRRAAYVRASPPAQSRLGCHPQGMGADWLRIGRDAKQVSA